MIQNASWARVFLVALSCQLPSLCGESAEIFGENKSSSVRFDWKTEDQLLLTVFRLQDGTRTELWMRKLQIPEWVFGSMRISVSDNAQVVVFEDHQIAEEQALLFVTATEPIRSVKPAELIQLAAPGKTAKPFPTVVEGLPPSSVKELESSAVDFGNTLFDWWNIDGSLRFFDQVGGDLLYCLWIGGPDVWLSWKAVVGSSVQPSKNQVAAWNDRANAWARQIVRAKWSNPLDLDGSDYGQKPFWLRAIETENVLAASKFLARHRQQADRQWITKMLEDPLIGGGQIGGQREGRFHQIELFANSEFRDVGDRLLAQWDGKWPDDRKPLPDFRGPMEAGEDYYYLGVVKGTVELPFPPRDDDGVLWIYLLPGSTPLSDWAKQKPSIRLVAEMRDVASTNVFGAFSGVGTGGPEGTIEYSRAVKFSFQGVTPGHYRAKAVWDKNQPVTNSWHNFAVPGPGDYQSDFSAVIQVQAGQTIENVRLSCTNRIDAASGLYAADDDRIPEAETANSHGSRQIAQETGPIASKEIWLTNMTAGDITLRKLTFGTQHKYYSAKADTKENVLVLWYTRRGDDLTGPMLEFEVRSDSGAKKESLGGGMSVNGSRTVYWCTLNWWPRRQKDFQLLILASDLALNRTQTVGEFRLPNPAFEEYPIWEAETLPVTRSFEDLDVTLQSLSKDYFQPQFHFRSKLSAKAQWEVADYVFEDPTGNKSYSATDLENEPVLKLTANLLRTTNAAFRRDESWTLPVTVPDPGKFVRLATNKEIQGVEIQILALCGRGEITYSNNVPISATTAIDKTALPYDANLCKWCSYAPVPFPQPPNPLAVISNRVSRLFGRQQSATLGRQKPLVFIKGNGRDAYDVPFDMLGLVKEKPVVVVSEVPHVAMRIGGLTSEHRLYVGSVRVDGRFADSPFDDFRHRQEVYFLPLSEKTGAESELKFAVQKRRSVQFTVAVPQRQSKAAD